MPRNEFLKKVIQAGLLLILALISLALGGRIRFRKQLHRMPLKSSLQWGKQL